MESQREMNHEGRLERRSPFGRKQYFLNEKRRDSVREYSFDDCRVMSLHKNRYFSTLPQNKMPLFEMTDSAWINLSKMDIFSIIDDKDSSSSRRASAFNRLIFSVENELLNSTPVSTLSSYELKEGAQIISYLGKLTLWNSDQHDARHHIECNWIASKILSYTCGLNYRPYRDFLNHMIEYCDLGISYQQENLQRYDDEIKQYRYKNSYFKYYYEDLKKEGKKILGFLYSHKGRAYDLKMHLKKQAVIGILTQEILDDNSLRASAYLCYKKAKQFYPNISKIVTISMIDLITSSGYHPTGREVEDTLELSKLAESIKSKRGAYVPAERASDAVAVNTIEQSLTSESLEASKKLSGGAVRVKNVQEYLVGLQERLELEKSETDDMSDIARNSESVINHPLTIQTEEDVNDIVATVSLDSASESSMSEGLVVRRPYGTGKAAEGKIPDFVDLRKNPSIASVIHQIVRDNPTISIEELSKQFPALTPRQLDRQIKVKRSFGEAFSQSNMTNSTFLEKGDTEVEMRDQRKSSSNKGRRVRSKIDES